MISDDKKKMFRGAVADVAKTRMDIVTGAIRGLLSKDLNRIRYKCFCYNCNKDKVTDTGMPVTSYQMILCTECGNKRCPRATDHNNKCTGSNAAGQPGSRY